MTPIQNATSDTADDSSSRNLVLVLAFTFLRVGPHPEGNLRHPVIELVDVVQQCVPDALFVFTSTDMVYDGEHAPYSVVNSSGTATNGNAEPRPVNVYGATKLAFEKEVMKLKNGNVLRLSNMIGECVLCCAYLSF